MYLTTDEYHALHENRLLRWHRLSQANLRFVESCALLTASVGKRFVKRLRGGLAATDGNGRSVMAGMGDLGHEVLAEDAPAFVADIAHASAHGVLQLIHAAESQLEESRILAAHLLERGLKAAPPDFYWSYSLAEVLLKRGTEGAAAISGAAALATKMVDKEIREELQQAPVRPARDMPEKRRRPA